ncbi:MAG: hypothetical protein JW751_30970 [Polyangiaceae bacterium]|nr:hypothetical protein [Polyangiaceae bacterium]
MAQASRSTISATSLLLAALGSAAAACSDGDPSLVRRSGDERSEGGAAGASGAMAAAWVPRGAGGAAGLGALPSTLGGTLAEGGGAGGPGGASGAGGAEGCACTRATVHLSLECACEFGFCTTWEHDRDVLQRFYFDRPYFVRQGHCAEGLRTLDYGNAAENRLHVIYDAAGNLLYYYYGYYDRSFYALSPEAAVRGCGSDHGEIGTEVPVRDCDYCLLRVEDADGFYPESEAPLCPTE